MEFLRISIVVPSYNQGVFLEETLSSITSQHYPNLELFVVDGDSSDESVEIIKKYERDITWWLSEKDKGQSNAINKGFSRATGEIITWINSDDLLIPGALHSVAKYFSSVPTDVGLIHGGTILFNAKREIKRDWGYSNPSLERNLAGMAFSQPSAFIKKQYLDVVGNKLNEQLHYGMDYDLFCRLACVCRFLPVKDVFSRYRLHEHSKSIAEQYHFIADWNKVFANFCKNAGWEDLLKELAALEMVAKEHLSFYYPYDFRPDQNILKQADKNKVLFYHYCYMLKSWYRSGLIIESKKLSRLIRQKFPLSWWQQEEGIAQIMQRLKLPSFLIRGLKTIKSKL